MASMDPGLQGYTPEATLAFYERLQEKLAARPDISAVGLTETLPLGLGSSDRGVGIPGYEFAEGERNSLHYAVIAPGYLEAMGTRLVEGRAFTRSDDAEALPVLIINQRFAERFWPGESALGKIVSTAGKDRQVIGVVETGKYLSLGEGPTEFMFLPQRDVFRFGMTLVARTPGPPTNALATLRTVVAELDADLPLFDVRTMEDHMGIALMPARLGGIVLGLFGGLGLLLAAVGIYGVMAYSVAQRKRELGIRVALGADRLRVTRQVLREGLNLALLGTAVGLVAAAGAARLVQGLLYSTRALDPLTFTAVPLVLLLVAAAAVYLPARRAARVDPARVLGAE
jgi:predicted permease